MQAPPGHSLGRIRRHVHFLLDPGAANTLAAHATHIVLTLAIIISVAAMVLQSIPALENRWSTLFWLVEYTAIAIFTIEYGLRLWTAPEHALYSDMSEWRARWRYVFSPAGLVDLVSILPLYAALFIAFDLRALLLFRLLRYFKLARYSAGMRSLIAVLQVERKALLATSVVLMGVVILSASLIHIVEGSAQPDKFGTIPDSMWWAIVTLTTVGYGDAVPVTAPGRIIAAFTMVMGLLMIALPVGIIATAFSEEIHRREFVINWGMLARVPLFSSLSAAEIAELMRYLRAQSLPSGAIIFKRGDPASCMYFIADGAVEIETAGGPVRLGEGQFFGEVAMLQVSTRSSSARIAQPAKLLVLEITDVFALMERNPDVRERIERVAAQRGAMTPPHDN